MSRSAVELLLDDADCSTVEKMILMVIARHGKGMNGSGGYPSARRIVRKASISRSTLHSVLGSLRAKGWLSWTSGNARQNKANTYHIHFDKIPMINWPISVAESPYLGSRVSPPVSVAESAPYLGSRDTLSRFDPKPISVAGHQANTEAKTTTKTHTAKASAGADSAGADTRESARKPSSSSSSSRSRKKQSPDGDVCVSLLRAWNDNCEPEFRRVKDTPTRRNLLRICIKRHHVTPAMIFEAVQYLKSSDSGGGGFGFHMTFDQLIQHDTIVRTLLRAESRMAKANGGKHANA